MAIEKVVNVNVNVNDKGLNKLDKSFTDISKKSGTLDKQNKKTAKSAKGIGAAFKGIGTAISGAIPALSAFKTALVSTGVGAIVVAMGSLVTLFTSAAKKGAEFSKAMSGLKAVTGSTSEELSVLANQAKELGSTTAFTAVEVAGLQTELAKLGFSVQDIANATPAILDLSASLEVDLASAATFAGSVVRSFGLETSETQRVVDVMALSTSSSALNFEALTESMKVVAPTSKALGISVEKTTALLGVLADTGLKGSIAGTGLSKTFIELNKKGITLDEAFNKVNNSSNQLNTAINLVGDRGAKSLLNLASAGDKIGDLEDKFNKAAGAAKNIAETRLDNLAGDTTKLKSAWEGFLLGIEDGEGILNKLLRGGVQLLTKGIENLGVAFNVIGFIAKDLWSNLKLRTSAGVDVLTGLFNSLGASIKVFANKALLVISEIPIIGKTINKSKVEANLKEAEAALFNSVNRIAEGQKKFAESEENNRTRSARLAIYLNDRKNKQIELSNKKAAEKELAQLDKQNKEISDKQKEAAIKRANDIAKIRSNYRKKLEDKEAKTEVAKVELQKKRALKELDKLNATEKQKQEVIDYYAKLRVDAEDKDLANRIKKQELAAKTIDESNKRRLKQLQFDASQEGTKEGELGIKKQALELENQLILEDIERKRQLYALGTQARIDAESEYLNKKQDVQNRETELENQAVQIKKQAEAQKLSFAQNALGQISQLLGEQTAAGKATAIAQALINTYQGISNVWAEKSEAGLVGAGLVQRIATSAIVAAQGFASVKNIMKTKVPGGGGGGGGSVGGGAPAPAFNVVGTSDTNQLAQSLSQEQDPIQAYVVGSDVTSQQSMDRNIVETATISS